MGVSKASLRGLSIDKRLEKIREAEKAERKTVKVTPTSEDIRSLIVHPRGGGFPKDGAADWPDDGFTLRREQDGDITVERGGQGQQPQQPESQPAEGQQQPATQSTGESAGR
jgi:hypothetical protein